MLSYCFSTSTLLPHRLFLITSLASSVVNVCALLSLLIADRPTLPILNQFQQFLLHRPLMASHNSNEDDNNNNNANGTPQSLFLFDFDGVVCDSCDECTVSALRTCHKLNVLKKHDDVTAAGENNQAIIMKDSYPPPWLFAKMREIRPAIEVGWQIPVLLAVFLEQQQQKQSPDEKLMSVEEIIVNYQTLIDKWLEKWHLTESDMVDTFGSVRDAWIAEDMASWLDINKFYPGVPEALSNCQGKGILVTTKQQRFAIALCRHAGVNQDALPDDCIYGLGMYQKKSDVIASQMQEGGYAPICTHFFEDRWPTLVKCLKDKRLDGVRFYLCSWGYVTKEELELASAEPRVEVIGLDDFARITTTP